MTREWILAVLIYRGRLILLVATSAPKRWIAKVGKVGPYFWLCTPSTLLLMSETDALIIRIGG